MVTTELGACEWFIWDLRRSNLIDRGQLDQVIGEFMQSQPRAEPPALAEFLVQKGILSQFQADRLLQGKTQGFVLGPFTLMDALGAGSMGTVYKAQSKNDSKWYAVKVLPRRSMWNVRIARRKVRSFEACRHPAVVPFVDVGTAGGMHYLAWPFVEGEGLDRVVQARGRLTPGVAAHYALQVAEGMDVCHQQALFHGLLKPSNLMVGNDHQVYILDFGIGCLLAETEGESLVDTMSTANSVASGLDCASPESIMDPTNLTPSGDQYSLGCVLYYCVTGQYPFPQGTSAEKMMAHQFKEPTPVRDLNPEVPPELVDVIQRLMQKAPENRYASAAEVVEALRPLAEAPSATPPVAKPAPRGATRPASSHDARPGSRQAAHPDARPAPRQGPNSDARPAATGPSAATPRPQGNLNLPNRQTVRAAPPAAEPIDVEVIEDGEVRARRPWDERLGTVGIIVIALAACIIGWALMMFVF
jgi:serine/threonine-protein kinase